MKCRYIIFFIIILFAIAAIFLLKKDQEFNGKYSFIDNYFSAVKENMDENVDIRRKLPSRSFDIGRIVQKKIFNNLFNHAEPVMQNGKTINAIKNPHDAMALLLKFQQKAGNRYLFDIKKEKGLEFINIEAEVKPDLRIAIKVSRDGKRPSVIDSFEYKNPDHGQENPRLILIYFDDYLTIFNSKEVVFQLKDLALKNKGDTSFKYISSSTKETQYLLKQYPLNLKETSAMLTEIKSKYPALPYYHFNLADKKWNLLYGEHNITIGGESSQYLARLQLNHTTMRSIYIPVKGILQYEVNIPDQAIFEAFLTIVPTYIESDNRIDFIMEITENGDPGNTKKFRFNFNDFGNDKNRFERIEYPLADFCGRDVSIKFSVETVDGELKNNEDKILVVLASPLISTPSSNKDINVVVILLDTLRADRLGCYGYKQRNTSPNIDILTKNGYLFENASSNASWTLPSHMSFFTSFFPYETGFYTNSKGQDKGRARITEKIDTFPDLLNRAGYRTIGITGGTFVSSIYGFDRGFDYYYGKPDFLDKALDHALNRMESIKDQKFFLFFHTYEIHEPYRHEYFLREEKDHLKSRKQISSARYDSGILYTDGQIKRLIDFLKQNKLFNRTIIIITSDHGENFDKLRLDLLEHWVGTHGFTLYDQVTQVPLIICGVEPFNKQYRCKTQVSLVDVMPTILEKTGIDVPDNIRGLSLLDKMIMNPENDARIAYSEGTIGKWEKKSIRTIQNKFIASKLRTNLDDNEFEFYNNLEYPSSRKNLYKSNDSTILSFKMRLEAIVKSIAARAKKILSVIDNPKADTEELENSLRDLGYLN
ncbi:MAG: sulfatase [Acidobacteria bacterium]|nr:sulfatase [Acidobacteriota bacterium]